MLELVTSVKPRKLTSWGEEHQSFSFKDEISKID